MPASKYQERKGEAAAAIAAGRDHHQAARTAGVHPSTLYRWLDKPDFQALIEAAHRDRERETPYKLSNIDRGELARWNTVGPLVPGDWQSWEEWRRVYEQVRAEYLDGLAARHEARLRNPTIRSQMKRAAPIPAAELIYQGMKRGESPAKAKARINGEIYKNDPREDMMRRPSEVR